MNVSKISVSNSIPAQKLSFRAENEPETDNNDKGTPKSHHWAIGLTALGAIALGGLYLLKKKPQAAAETAENVVNSEVKEKVDGLVGGLLKNAEAREAKKAELEAKFGAQSLEDKKNLFSSPEYQQSISVKMQNDIKELDATIKSYKDAKKVTNNTRKEITKAYNEHFATKEAQVKE